MEGKNLGAVVRKSRLVELPDGSNIEVRALVLSDFATIQEEASHALKRDLIETYTRNADLLPPAKRDDVILDAFHRAEDIRPDTISPSQMVGWLGTNRGMLISVWLSMRGAQPGITYDQVATLLSCGDFGFLKRIADIVGELSRQTIGKNGSPPLAAGEPLTTKTHSWIGRLFAGLWWRPRGTESCQQTSAA